MPRPVGNGRIDSDSLADLRWFRWLAAAALAATVVITWPLWAVRAAPPLLPLLPLPAVDLGAPILVAVALAAVRPLPGLPVLSALLLYAVAIDQTRLQPEIVSLAILLWGSLPDRGARLVARAHLISLWFFAGLHKLLSPAFLDGTAPRIVGSLIDAAPDWLLGSAGYLIAAAECALAVVAVVPRTRRLAGWWALALHAAILLAFSPIGYARNEAVWPWNVALAAGGFALIVPWRGSLLGTWRAAPGWSRAVAAAFLALPLGFYAGAVDAYLAHNLYGGNTPTATVSCPAACLPEQDANATWAAFRVPLPPAPRLYRAAFVATCRRGDLLIVEDFRPLARLRGAAIERLTCPAGAIPPSHPGG